MFPSVHPAQQLAEFVGPSPLSCVSAGGLDLSSLSQKMNQLAASAPSGDGNVDLLGDLPTPDDLFPNRVEELNICTSDGRWGLGGGCGKEGGRGGMEREGVKVGGREEGRVWE